MAALAIALVKPEHYKYYNLLTVSVMLTHRIFEFYRFKMLFYMLDWCYMVNIFVIISSVIYPQCYWLFICSFGFACGPLFFSIPVYQLSFAFHNTLRMTSLWIHLSAPITMLLMRWCGEYRDLEVGDLVSFVKEYYGGAIMLYFTWAIVYYYIVFKLCFNYIKSKNLDCLYFYTDSQPKFSKKMLIFGEKYKDIGFMFLHFRMAFFFTSVAVIPFYSYWLSLVICAAMVFSAIWNTSTYYLDYFSLHYEKQFVTKKKDKALKNKDKGAISSAETNTSDSDTESIPAKPI
jgi:hypothetical protein